MYRMTVDGGTYDCEGTIQSSISSLGRNVDSYLYLVEGVPVPMDIVPEDEAIVIAIRVASGG